jgi:hypothetical protein
MRPLPASVSLVFAFLGTLSPALSQERDDERVREGLLVRFTAGAGYARCPLDGYLEEETVFSGTTLSAEMTVGGVLFPGLAVHGSAWGWDMVFPSLYRRWGGADDQYTTSDATARMGAFGAGVTQFLTSGETYWSLMVGAGFQQMEGPEDTFPQPIMGLAGRALLGWNWWRRGNWGMGLTATLDVVRSGAEEEGHLGEDGDDPGWTSFALTACFSATYN